MYRTQEAFSELLRDAHKAEFESRFKRFLSSEPMDEIYWHQAATDWSPNFRITLFFTQVLRGMQDSMTNKF